jgi:twitching motility protein PilT
MNDASNKSAPLEARAFLAQLLTQCIKRGASDLHLSPGLPPHVRVDGELVPNGADAITAAQSEAIAENLLEFLGTNGATLHERLNQKGSLDGALSSADGARFRFNIFRRQRELVIVLRRLEDRFRSLAELGLSENLHTLCDLRDGLIVVSGPTGSGKSTTLATLIDRINQSRHGHIVTIEDPIEYIHRPIKSVVNQRQIGLDAPTFNDALVAALRQDPDVILLGEIRDLDTIRTAVVAAETGHLVFTTLHAGDCVSSVERLISVFPATEQEGMRRQLALVVKAIIAQHLLPAAESKEKHTRPARVATSEVLMVNPAVANLIATGKSAQIYSLMETGHSSGMQTLEQDLARLWVAGRITEAVAVATARNVNVLRSRVALLRKRADTANAQSTGVGGVAR